MGEEKLRNKGREVFLYKMRSGFFMVLVLAMVYGLLNNMFEAEPVAKIPFYPISLIRGITHRNLPGTDYTDCSMTLILILCSMSIRANITKFLGFAPKMPQMFKLPEDHENLF